MNKPRFKRNFKIILIIILIINWLLSPFPFKVEEVQALTYGTYTFDADNDSDEDAWTFVSDNGTDGLNPANTARAWSHDTDDTTSNNVGPTSGQGGSPDGYVYTEMSSPGALGDTFHMTHNTVLDAATYDWTIEFYWNQRGDSNLTIVEVQTNEDGAGWVDRGTYAEGGPDVATGGTQVWNYVSLDLSSVISNSSTQIRLFLTVPSSGTAWHNDLGLDTITLTGTAQSTTSFTQNSYRWYVDNDATNPTDPWGNPNLAENTAITVTPVSNDPPNSIQELRLRINLTVNSADLSATSQQFKLQFKAGTDGSCTAGSWTDVGSGAWVFATSSVTDGANITGVLSSTDVDEEYAKSNPTQTNHNSATTTQDIEYDFHIVGTSAAEATQYSFRILESDDTVLDAYTNCPTLMTEPGTSLLMRHGSFFAEQLKKGFFWTD